MLLGKSVEQWPDMRRQSQKGQTERYAADQQRAMPSGPGHPPRANGRCGADKSSDYRAIGNHFGCATETEYRRIAYRKRQQSHCYPAPAAEQQRAEGSAPKGARSDGPSGHQSDRL